MSEVRYRRLEDNDRDSVLALFKACFGKDRDPDEWHWEFKEGPNRGIVVLAEVDSRVVGHYAILPRKIKVGAQSVRAGLVVDVMTHPDYGRRGIFVNSGLEAFRQAKEAGLQMLVGFPNEAAIRGHMKVGWSELGTVRVLVRPLKPEAFSKTIGGTLKIPSLALEAVGAFLDASNKLLLGPIPRDASVEWTTADGLHSIEKEYDGFISEVLGQFSVCNVRELAWMKWRLSNPSDKTHVLVLRNRHSNDLIGLGVLRVKHKDGILTGAVMEVLARKNDAGTLRTLAQEILRKSIDVGCEIVVMLKSPAADWIGAFTRMMFVPTPRTLRFIVRSTQDAELPDEAYKLGRWHLGLIDHDVF